MQRQLIGILSLLFSSFLFAVPASAANLPECTAPDGTTEFVLISEDNIIFEAQQVNSGRIINGNVLVTSIHPLNGTFNNTGKGFVRVGANTNINGTVIADVIFLPDGGATITDCVANTLVANTAAAQAVAGPGPARPTSTPVSFSRYYHFYRICDGPPHLRGVAVGHPDVLLLLWPYAGGRPLRDWQAPDHRGPQLPQSTFPRLLRRSDDRKWCRAQSRPRGVYLPQRPHEPRRQADRRAINPERERQVLR